MQQAVQGQVTSNVVEKATVMEQVRDSGSHKALEQ